jgi:hypothetical protein
MYGLSAENIEYTEQMMEQMDLTQEQETAFRLLMKIQ